MSVARRRAMIEPDHQRLSIAAQCRLLSISRSSYYYAPVPESEETLALMRVIDAAFLDMPWYGSRQMVRHLRRGGHDVGRRRVRRLMGKMGLSPIYQRPRTSDRHPQHRVYPYLLRKLAIERPNHVWCADVTPAFAGAGQASRCAAASCTWSPSWTGRPARCSPGACRTRWTLGSASLLWRKRWRASGGPRSSTPIRVASSPASRSPACCATPRCGSAWMVGGGGWTMSSSNASGAR